MTLLGSAVMWPLAARAQQAVPVIGFLNARSKDNDDVLRFLDAFRHGLAEGGYIEGRNVAIEARWADGHYDRLRELAAGLVSRGVAVIFAGGGRVSARAAQAATSTIPIVFDVGGDPVADGYVQSFAHPGGNLTGVVLLTASLGPKRLSLLRELAPEAALAMLVNANGPSATNDARDLEAAAAAIGRSIRRLEVTGPADLDRAFAALAEGPASALLVNSDPFFSTVSPRLVELAMRRRIPVIYFDRSFVEAGGLMSYGASIADAYRQCGLYVARILNGEKPADLPVAQPTRFELVVNLKAAKAIGLTVPPTLLIAADEVIE